MNVIAAGKRCTNASPTRPPNTACIPGWIWPERCGVRPLVVKDDPGRGVDWTQLSRKHVIEVDNERRYLTIFGGKLTDCLNVGEEVVERFRRFGIGLRVGRLSRVTPCGVFASGRS